MAFINSEIKLLEYDHSIRVSLYFPTDMSAVENNEVKGVIWLLHGYYGCGQDWMLFTAACRYAADNGYILVAPDAENSFYLDMAYGKPYFHIMTEALPGALHRIYKLPTEREKNFICGLSMGGYGALHIALTCPERFAAVGCFSGAVDLEQIVHDAKMLKQMHKNVVAVLGVDEKITPDLDVFHLADEVAKLPAEEQPRIFLTCGRHDYMYDMSRNYADHLAGLPLDCVYKEWDGVHEWNFWDRSLAEFIGFFRRDDYAERKRADWSDN